MAIDRRRFLQGVLSASGAALAGHIADRAEGLPLDLALRSLPFPEQSGIDHIIVLMMENRSFDHQLGWLPTARGQQDGLVYLDAGGVPHATHRLLGEYKGCGHPDPDHSYEGGRTQYDNGRMAGFLQSGHNDEYAIGYYAAADRPVFAAIARNYTSLDGYFCSILGPTFPNRIFQHAAQTDRLDNAVQVATLPTIWDRLAAAGVSARYYFSNLPFLGLWGLKYLPIAATFDRFLDDAAAGSLPAVSFLDPKFTVADGVFANDDHPHADIRAGEAFVADVVRAVTAGPAWSRTVLVINYDEWGGFFDHVPPPRAAAANSVDTDVVDGRTLLGIRVPTIVVSPFTRGNPFFPRVNHLVYDHTSVLKLIEWRWRLEPLTPRDASFDVQNLVWALRLGAPNLDVPVLPDPEAPPPSACAATGAADTTTGDSAWLDLLNSGLLEGWRVSL